MASTEGNSKQRRKVARLNSGIRWLPTERAQLERAAEILSERMGIDVTPTDVIRRATLRHLKEIGDKP